MATTTTTTPYSPVVTPATATGIDQSRGVASTAVATVPQQPTTAINASNLAPQPTLPTPTVPPSTTAQNTLGASVASYQPPTAPQPPQGWDAQTYANFKAANPTLEPTAEDTAHMQQAGQTTPQNAILNRLLGYSNDLGTQGDFTTQTNKQYGIDTKSQQVTDLTNQYNSRARYYDDQIQAVTAKNALGISADAQQQKVDELTRQKNHELADIAIQQSAANGNLSTAQALAKQVVDAKFEPIKQQISLMQTMYGLLQNDMSESDKMKAQANISAQASQVQFNQQKEMADYNAKIQKAAKDHEYFLQYGTPPPTSDGTGGDGTPNDPVSAASRAILGNESNGDYTTLSPVLKGGSYVGQRSYGKYQVLQSNIPSWTKQYFGQSLTPEEFLNNPAAQEAVQQGKISDLWKQYGNINDVASAYFTGLPYDKAVAKGARDQATGMTVQQYVAKAAKAFGASQDGSGAPGGADSTNSTDFKAGVPITDAGVLSSKNPNDQVAYQLATGDAAPSQVLTARNLSATSPAGRLILARANAISQAKYGKPFSLSDAEAGYKVRNSAPYQTFITSAPTALRAVGEVMKNLQTIKDAGYLTGITNLNSIKLKMMANGTAFWVPQDVRNAAATVLSSLAQSQDDIGKLLGTGQGSDAKITLAGEIFGHQGNLNTTTAVAQNVSKNITQKMQDYFSAANISANSPYVKMEMERLQPSLDIIAGKPEGGAVAPTSGKTSSGLSYTITQ